MKDKYILVQMSFDGEYVIDSKHDTLEEAENTSADLGSKWYFFPWSIIVKGKTVVETGGAFYNMQTNEPILSELLKGKRFTTVQKLFEFTYGTEESAGVGTEEYEDLLIYIINNKIKTRND